jgi:hypothetical protein
LVLKCKNLEYFLLQIITTNLGKSTEQLLVQSHLRLEMVFSSSSCLTDMTWLSLVKGGPDYGWGGQAGYRHAVDGGDERHSEDCFAPLQEESPITW